MINELKNVVKSVPVGLQTPSYTTLAKNDEYEIRKYDQYSVCTTTDEENGGQGNSFNVLADYIFGEGNVDNMEMSMTTPGALIYLTANTQYSNTLIL